VPPTPGNDPESVPDAAHLLERIICEQEEIGSIADLDRAEGGVLSYACGDRRSV
jgi:hypothetical protein